MILFAVLAAVAVSVAAMTLNLRRQPVPPDELQPNLLMTKHPIEFWTGPRTLFHFQSYWHDWPVHLAAHGYEVHFIELAWRDRRARLRQARARLEDPRRHLVIDECTAREMADLLRDRPPASVTVLRAPAPRGLPDRFCFFVHRGLLRASGVRVAAASPTTAAELLGTMTSIAENDWVQIGLSS